MRIAGSFYFFPLPFGLEWNGGGEFANVRRDESFLRLLVGKLKRMDMGSSRTGNAPWRNAAERCRLYHDHAERASSSCGENEGKRK